MGTDEKRTLWVGKLGLDSRLHPVGPEYRPVTGREYRVLIDDAALRRMVLKASSAKTKRATDGPLTVVFE